ncbi:MAG: hypothetical protein AB2L20_08800 [Mangrovibacterium sp.]
MRAHRLDFEDEITSYADKVKAIARLISKIHQRWSKLPRIYSSEISRTTNQLCGISPVGMSYMLARNLIIARRSVTLGGLRRKMILNI